MAKKPCTNEYFPTKFILVLKGKYNECGLGHTINKILMPLRYLLSEMKYYKDTKAEDTSHTTRPLVWFECRKNKNTENQDLIRGLNKKLPLSITAVKSIA